MSDKFQFFHHIAPFLAAVPPPKMNAARMIETLIIGAVAGGVSVYATTMVLGNEITNVKQDLREIKRDIRDIQRDVYRPRLNTPRSGWVIPKKESIIV